MSSAWSVSLSALDEGSAQQEEEDCPHGDIVDNFTKTKLPSPRVPLSGAMLPLTPDFAGTIPTRASAKWPDPRLTIHPPGTALYKPLQIS